MLKNHGKGPTALLCSRHVAYLAPALAFECGTGTIFVNSFAERKRFFAILL